MEKNIPSRNLAMGKKFDPKEIKANQSWLGSK